MIARGFKPVAWVAAIGAAALSCYMLSLQVASERAELASIERRIVATRQDIRTLQTELGTRGRLQQLESWNADVLALSAPVSGQFLESNVSLARFDTRQPGVGERAAQVQLAAAEVPMTPSRVTVAPRRAALVERPVAVASLESPQPRVQRASATLVEAPAIVRPTAGVRPAAAASATRRGLLDDSTLRDLNRAARTERGGARN
jgi:hypothetical protein